MTNDIVPQSWWRRTIEGTARFDRLSTTISDLGQAYRNHPRRDEPGVRPIIAAAEESLKQAEDALHGRDLNTGWALIHRAERTIVLADSPDGLRARAIRLREEASEKLTGWRQKAALRALPDDATVTPDDVQMAMDMLSQHAGNMYHKAELFADQIKVIGRITSAMIVIILLASYAGLQPLTDTARLAWAAVLGALGGTLSASRGLTLGMRKKIPDQVYSWPVTLTRPLVGAAAGLGAFITLTAGIVSLAATSTEIGPLAAAFLAGFSERYFLSLLPASDKKSSG